MASESETALAVADAYVAAMATGDTAAMDSLRSDDFILDWVHGDAFANKSLSAEETKSFWPSWLRAFPERDFEVTRTIAAQNVVVTQWIFTGVHTQPLEPPVFDPPLAQNGRTIRFRGVSFYDIQAGKIQRETTYLDLATLMVEMGVTL